MVNVRLINFKSPYLNYNQNINQSRQDFKASKTRSDCFQSRTANQSSLKFGKNINYNEVSEKLNLDVPKIVAEGIKKLAGIPVGKEPIWKKLKFSNLRTTALIKYRNLVKEQGESSELTEAAKDLIYTTILTRPSELSLCPLLSNKLKTSYDNAFNQAIEQACLLPQESKQGLLETLSNHLLGIKGSNSNKNEIKPNLTDSDVFMVYSKIAEAEKKSNPGGSKCLDIIENSVKEFANGFAKGNYPDSNVHLAEKSFKALQKNIPSLIDTITKLEGDIVEKLNNSFNYYLSQQYMK